MEHNESIIHFYKTKENSEAIQFCSSAIKMITQEVETSCENIVFKFNQHYIPVKHSPKSKKEKVSVAKIFQEEENNLRRVQMRKLFLSNPEVDTDIIQNSFVNLGEFPTQHTFFINFKKGVKLPRAQHLVSAILRNTKLLSIFFKL
jgi:hypothetical protein